jgi:hypothetical protein
MDGQALFIVDPVHVGEYKTDIFTPYQFSSPEPKLGTESKRPARIASGINFEAFMSQPLGLSLAALIEESQSQSLTNPLPSSIQ